MLPPRNPARVGPNRELRFPSEEGGVAYRSYTAGSVKENLDPGFRLDPYLALVTRDDALTERQSEPVPSYSSSAVGRRR